MPFGLRTKIEIGNTEFAARLGGCRSSGRCHFHSVTDRLLNAASGGFWSGQCALVWSPAIRGGKPRRRIKLIFPLRSHFETRSDPMRKPVARSFWLKPAWRIILRGPPPWKMLRFRNMRQHGAPWRRDRARQESRNKDSCFDANHWRSSPVREGDSARRWIC